MMKPKPCPVCGGMVIDVWHVVFTRRFAVECRNCHHFGKSRIFKWRAIRAWNKEKSQWLRVNT